MKQKKTITVATKKVVAKKSGAKRRKSKAFYIAGMQYGDVGIFTGKNKPKVTTDGVDTYIDDFSEFQACDSGFKQVTGITLKDNEVRKVRLVRA